MLPRVNDAPQRGPDAPEKVPGWVTCADLLAIALLAIAIWVGATGGIRRVILHVRISVTDPWRPVLLALVVLAARHLVFRRPTLAGRILTLLARTWRLAGRLSRRLLARLRGWLRQDDCVYVRDGGRRASQMPARELLLVALLMIGLTCLMTWPQVARLNAVPDLGDPLFSTWRLAWVAHQFPLDPLHLFDANIFYPERLTLAYSDSILLPALAVSPFLWLGVPGVIVYNLLMLSTFVLAGTAMYVLVRTLTGQAPPALVAAVIFAFYPFRFEHYSHLELQVSFWMPLVLLALHRTIASGRRRHGLLMGALFAAQVYSCMYLGVFLAAYLVPCWAIVATGWRRVRSALPALVLGAVLAGAVLAPLAVPYVQARHLVGERNVGEVEYYSALPRDYLNPHWTLATYASLDRRAMPERALFPGIVAVALAVIGLWPPLSTSRLAYAAGLLFAFDASLGYHGYSYPLLRSLVPAFHGLRVPARISMLVGFSLAVLAGYGVARLTRSVPPRARWVVAGLAAIVLLVEVRPRLPFVSVDLRPDPIYAYFDGRPTGVLAELPTGQASGVVDTDFQYMYASTFHWQRLLNGVSGFIPLSKFEFQEAVADFPDDRAMNLLVSRRTDYVMVHELYYGRERYATVIATADGRRDLREVSRSRHGGFETRLYQIVR
jgi:hypothetical protein